MKWVFREDILNIYSIDYKVFDIVQAEYHINLTIQSSSKLRDNGMPLFVFIKCQFFFVLQGLIIARFQ